MSEPDHYTPPPAEDRRERRSRALAAFSRDARRAVESAPDHKPSTARHCCLCGNTNPDDIHQIHETKGFLCNFPHR